MTVFPLQGIMLVYDICNEKSFENIKNWIRNIEEVSSEWDLMVLHEVWHKMQLDEKSGLGTAFYKRLLISASMPHLMWRR